MTTSDQTTVASQNSNKATQTQTTITILTLIFLPLIGLILMWVWKVWSKTARVIITSIFAGLIVIGIIILLVFSAIIFQAVKQDIKQSSTQTNSTILTSQKADAKFITPKTDPYEMNEVIKANGQEFTVTGLKKYQLVSDYDETEKTDYCNVAFKFKNTLDESITINRLIDFTLTSGPAKPELPLILIGQSQITKPEITELDDKSLEVAPGQEINRSVSFDCDVNASTFTLTNETNQLTTANILSSAEKFVPINVSVNF